MGRVGGVRGCQKPGPHLDDMKMLQAAYRLYTTFPCRHENRLTFDGKRGPNYPQSDRRRRETHRGNSILCKIKTDGHTGADQFEIIDLLAAVQKFLPRLFPQGQNKNRSLNKSELWKVLFC